MSKQSFFPVSFAIFSQSTLLSITSFSAKTAVKPANAATSPITTVEAPGKAPRTRSAPMAGWATSRTECVMRERPKNFRIPSRRSARLFPMERGLYRFSSRPSPTQTRPSSGGFPPATKVALRRKAALQTQTLPRESARTASRQRLRRHRGGECHRHEERQAKRSHFGYSVTGQRPAS